METKGQEEEDGEPEVKHEQQYSETERDKRFKCNTCGKKYEHMSSLKRHLQQHDPRETIKCSDCHQFFECDKDLEEHNSKCHNEDFMCNICGKNFNTRWKFVNHTKIHYAYRKRYVCEFDGCDERFEKYSRLIAHLNKHSNIKPYHCPRCQKSFSSNENFKRHTHICQYEKLFSCSECSKTFKSSGALSAHITSIHKAESFICDVCGIKYRYRSGLLNHKQKKNH